MMSGSEKVFPECHEHHEYRVSGKPENYICLVSESREGCVVAKRKAFGTARFETFMSSVHERLSALKAFGTRTVTWINAISLSEECFSTVEERAKELALLLPCILSDQNNELFFVELHDEYEEYAPVFEQLGFTRQPDLEYEGVLVYTYQRP